LIKTDNNSWAADHIKNLQKDTIFLQAWQYRQWYHLVCRPGQTSRKGTKSDPGFEVVIIFRITL